MAEWSCTNLFAKHANTGSNPTCRYMYPLYVHICQFFKTCQNRFESYQDISKYMYPLCVHTYTSMDTCMLCAFTPNTSFSLYFVRIFSKLDQNVVHVDTSIHFYESKPTPRYNPLFSIYLVSRVMLLRWCVLSLRNSLDFPSKQ